MNKNQLKILWLFTIANKYFHLSKIVFEESLKSWNIWMSENIDDTIYDEETKRSDFNIIIPNLFLFFHWIEVLLKWYTLLYWENSKHNHNIWVLYNNLQSKYAIKDIHILEKYIIKEKLIYPLNIFLKENNEDINMYYSFFRYSYNKSEKIYKYLKLHYQEDKNKPLMRNIIQDINILNRSSVKAYRKKFNTK